MSLMKLPHPFSQPPAPERVLFFVVHIAETYVESALWSVADNKLTILTQSGRHHWHNDGDCVTAIDKSLQELGKESESVTHTLFALRSEWVTSAGILPAKKPLFQKITTELSLEAIGFVVTSEAMIQYLTDTSSPQLSMFFMDFSQQQLTVSLVQNGQIRKTEKVGRSGESVSDIIEAFAQFEDKVFPAKFFLFSSFLSPEELSEVQQQLLAHSWTSAYPFLHQPIVEIYPSTQLLHVIVQSGGKAVAQARGLLKAHVSAPEPVVQHHVSPSTPAAKTEEFGFTPVAKADDDLAIANVKAVTAIPPLTTPLPKQPSMSSPEPAQHFQPPLQKKKQTHVPFIALGIFAGVIVLILLFIIIAGQRMRAQVVAMLNTQPLEKSVTLTIDPSVTHSDPTKLLLHADIIPLQLSNQKTIAASGTKTVGEKAKGKVTLYNLTGSAKTFAAGTTLAHGTLKYTLDQSVTIASASSTQDAQNNIIIKPSTSDAAATAVQIGTESNLDKDSDFVVENFDKKTFTARTDTGFSGGTSRDVQVVAAADRDTLLTSMKKSFIDQATQQFSSQSGDGRFIIPSGKIKVLKSSLSPDVGKEATSVTLNLQVEVDGLAYQLADMKPLAMQILSSDIPTGYQISQSDPHITPTVLNSASGSAQTKVQADIRSEAVPVIQPDDVRTIVAGKSVTTATAALQSRSDMKSVKVTMMPSFFALFFHTIPKKFDRIDVQLLQ